MTGRTTILAAIIAFMFQIVVAHAYSPEDDTSYQAFGVSAPQARHYHKRATVEKVSPPVKKQEVQDNELLRARGRELISRMRKDIGTDPTHWGTVWCAKYISQLSGRNGKNSINLAADWARQGIRAPDGAIGSVASSSYHVGVIIGGKCPAGRINMISGNFTDHKVNIGCVPRGDIIAYRWVSIANSQVAAKVPLPRPRPEFPPLPTPNPEPRVYETALPPQSQPITYDSFDTYIFPPLESEPVKPTSTFVRTGPFVMSVRPETMQPGDIDKIVERDECQQYLCSVYRRTPRKVDQTGDFSWKDIAAAKKMGKSLCQYVIGGLARSTQKAYCKAGHAMDSAGIHWSILSAFRDDWRQRIAAGIKACDSCSLHGGSRFGGYGNGMAIDITTITNDFEPAANWIARYGRKYGIIRPYPSFDPAHTQVVERVAHLKPWRWFASADEPSKPRVAKVKPDPEYVLADLDGANWSKKPEKPVQVASIGKDIPLTGKQRVFQLIRAEAAKNGLDGDTLIQFAYLENGDEITTKSELGIFGLTAPERRRMKQRDNSLQEQIRAGVEHIKADWDTLKRRFKATPSAQNLYTLHFLGEGAGLAVIEAPNGSNLKNAIDRGEKGLGTKALAGNPGLRKLETVGAFKRSIEERLREARGVIRA